MTSARRAEALALRVFDYGESSQVLHLLTREEGRVHGIAKGARRLNGAFKGGVDALHLGEAMIYPRRPGAELRTLGGFETSTHFPGIHERISRFHAASHVLALLLALTREEEADPLVFDLAVAALRLVEASDDAQAEAVAFGFEAMLLHHAGFLPELTRCVACGRPARNVERARLSSLRGGLLCRTCASEDPSAPQATGEVIATLAKLAAGPLAASVRLGEDSVLRNGLRDSLDAWTTHVLDRPLRTRRFL